MANGQIQPNYDGCNRPIISDAAHRMLPPPSLGINPQFNERIALGRLQAAVTRLGTNEFRRRLWHFAPGILALMGACVPHEDTPAALFLAVTMLVCLGLALVAIRSQHTIRRPEERNCLAAILGYGAAVIPLFLLFPSQPELALTVAGIIAFGDGSATLVGLLTGTRKLPWNRKKSWAGTAAFVTAALPLATMIYCRGSLPHVSVGMAILCVGPTVVASALVESLPVGGNDNLYVGASAAATMIAMQGLVAGWS